MLFLAALAGCTFNCSAGPTPDPEAHAFDLTAGEAAKLTSATGVTGDTGAALTCADACLRYGLGEQPLYSDHGVESCDMTPLDDGGVHVDCVTTGPVFYCE